MILSNDGLVAFHYRSYGTFFLQQNRLHNIHRGFTHYKYYRAFLVILFENQIQTTSASPYRTQVQPAASFLVCSLIFIEYQSVPIQFRFFYLVIHSNLT